MKTITEALEEEITRGDCMTCSKKYYDKYSGIMKCEVTEEIIGTGKEYCAISEPNLSLI